MDRGQLRELWYEGVRQLKTLSKPAMIGLIGLLIISTCLFAERYAINLWRYHSPTPECNQVLSVDQCRAYGPWARNYRLANEKVTDEPWDAFLYTHNWLYQVMFELFFTIDNIFIPQQPLPLPKTAAFLVVGAGAVLVIYHWRRLRRINGVGLFVPVIVIYVLALWLQNYFDYMNTGYPVAIHGRYLLPFLPIMMLFIGLAYQAALAHRQRLQLGLLAVVFFCFLQGGGVMTYILRSYPDWYFENNFSQQLNLQARKFLGPIIKQ